MAIKLKDIELFEGIDLQTIWYIIDNSRRETFSAWEAIIKQWEKTNGSAYIIQEWTVRVEIDWNEITKLNEWEVFWEIALITDEPRVASVIAESNIVTLKIDKELLHTIIKEFKNWKQIQEVLMKRIIENTKKQYLKKSI